jgi:organic radical activating enzyme
MSGTSSGRVEGEYKVSEIFYSLQGEGLNAGRPAFFIRLAGCNLNCDFCDTPQKDNGGWTRKASIHTHLDKLAMENSIHLFSAGLVITGGEPTLQIDTPLLDLACAFPWCDIETNGTNPIAPELDGFEIPPNIRISVSPKSEETLQQLMVTPSQIKVLVPSAVRACTDAVLTTLKYWHDKGCLIYLQPLDVKDKEVNALHLNACLMLIKWHPWMRLSAQLHKLLAFQ